jgi:hypothetical protein
LFNVSCVKGFTQNDKPHIDKLMEFRMYFDDDNIVAIQKYLEEGNDPNKCIGPYGWIDENPLWIILNFQTGNSIEIFNLLIAFDANVNLRPYIWHIIDQQILTPSDIEWQEDIQEGEDERAVMGTTEELIYKKVEILINAGADVNAKGAKNKMLFPSIDEVYKAYFEKEGTRPINYAIKKIFQQLWTCYYNIQILMKIL